MDDVRRNFQELARNMAAQREAMMPRMPIFTSIPDSAFESLIEEVKAFQEELGNDMELGVAADGAGYAVHVSDIYLNGQIIVFNGVDNHSRKARLMMHYTQTNIILLSVPKLSDEATRIGFGVPDASRD